MKKKRKSCTPLSDAAVVGRSLCENIGHSCILIRKMGSKGQAGYRYYPSGVSEIWYVFAGCV